MSETPPINVRLARALACIKADLVQVEFAGKALDDKDDEIERLRAEVAEKDRRIEDLMNHLKRVVAPVEVGGGTGGFHIITTEDIDKAWAKARAGDYQWAWEILDPVSIVACEKCGGSGEGDGSKDEYGYAKDCPYCDGHGWSINNAGVINRPLNNNEEVER